MIRICCYIGVLVCVPWFLLGLHVNQESSEVVITPQRHPASLVAVPILYTDTAYSISEVGWRALQNSEDPDLVLYCNYEIGGQTRSPTRLMVVVTSI